MRFAWRESLYPRVNTSVFGSPRLDVGAGTPQHNVRSDVRNVADDDAMQL